MAKIKVSIQAVQKLIDDLDDIIYWLGDDEGVPTYYPNEIYSDEEAYRITRDFFRVVAKFCGELQKVNHQSHLWVVDKVMADLLFGVLKWGLHRLADLLDKSKKE